jgi:hypothetical protein
MTDAPTPPTPRTSMADPAYATAAFIVSILSAAGLPSKLGLSTTVLMAGGGLLVAVLAIGRGVIDARAGRPVALQDKIATGLGALVALLVALGLPIQTLDADTTMAIASAAASAFALRRATKPA